MADTSKLSRDMYPRQLLEQIIEENRHINFVQRILDPSLKLKNPDGSVSTHSMAYAQIDNGYLVYPTVVQKGDKLIRLGDKEAIDHAIKNKEALLFLEEEMAKWFTENYKKLWK